MYSRTGKLSYTYKFDIDWFWHWMTCVSSGSFGPLGQSATLPVSFIFSHQHPLEGRTRPGHQRQLWWVESLIRYHTAGIGNLMMIILLNNKNIHFFFVDRWQNINLDNKYGSLKVEEDLGLLNGNTDWAVTYIILFHWSRRSRCLLGVDNLVVQSSCVFFSTETFFQSQM